MNTEIPTPEPRCDHTCLLDDGHVERGEAHQYGYVLGRASGEGTAPQPDQAAITEAKLRAAADQANASARRRGEERDALRAMVDGCREIVAEHKGNVDGDRPIDEIAAVVGYPERGTAPQVPAEGGNDGR